MNGWIGVDLDGTLAEVDYSTGYDYKYIGNPIPRMVERVKAWVEEGATVKIVTARVSSNCPERLECIEIIESWCIKHLGLKLEVTSEKDYWMRVLWDDRCVQVALNTGIPIQEAITHE